MKKLEETLQENTYDGEDRKREKVLWGLSLLELIRRTIRYLWKLLKKFNIGENKRIEKIGKNLRRAWKKKKKVLLELSLRELKTVDKVQC